MTRNLTELASSRDLIPGIYNYCDRWCERCEFTSRCLVYATENEDPLSQVSDSSNRSFWTNLEALSVDAQAELVDWAGKRGIDLSTSGLVEDKKKRRRQFDSADHYLSRAGKHYAETTTKWFSDWSGTLSGADDSRTAKDQSQVEVLRSATEVIQWYQYQIAVKTMRALRARCQEYGPTDEDEESVRDSDGSAKVALVGIDRSVVAWQMVQGCLTSAGDEIMQLRLQLHQLRLGVEQEFPRARDFIRPGFDEPLSIQHQ